MKTKISSVGNLLLLILIVFGCTNNSKNEIYTVADTFYKKYKLDLITIDRTFLTQDLLNLIADADNK